MLHSRGPRDSINSLAVSGRLPVAGARLRARLGTRSIATSLAAHFIEPPVNLIQAIDHTALHLVHGRQDALDVLFGDALNLVAQLGKKIVELLSELQRAVHR